MTIFENMLYNVLRLKTQNTKGVMQEKEEVMEERLLSATEVCVLLDCSIYSLNNWYTFKRENPDSEYAQMLPEFVNKDAGTRRKRFWKQSDIAKLIEFKATIPHGRNGVLGSVTQRYVKGAKSNGKKNSTRSKRRKADA